MAKSGSSDRRRRKPSSEGLDEIFGTHRLRMRPKCAPYFLAGWRLRPPLELKAGVAMNR
jgi:hypothetical protein